ncbi:transcriptional regulator [uncultured Microbacterium sp.]|uniref:helix-turn-helix transcriptional regulator n=1 Tax=uncultured Microbacterium sp. TaxID=191216 RepID=UPI0035CC430A
MVSVAPGLARTFGQYCEVVVHDYRDPDASVIAVGGDVTGRQVGDAMSDIGLRVLAAGDAAVPDIDYITRAEDGRLLKCSTFPLFDADAHLIGALCVNLDVSALHRAAAMLSDLGGANVATANPPRTDFSGDLGALIDSVTDAAAARSSAPIASLPRAERLEVVRALQDAGAFALRGAAVGIAARLGVSRAALYNDLSTIAEEAS